jgi:signal peptidase I
VTSGLPAAHLTSRGHSRAWLILGGGIIVCFGLFIAVRTWGYQPFAIESASMEPTLVQGDYMLVNRSSYGWNKLSLGGLFHQPERGDVVVFKLERDPGSDHVGRLLGLPGDQLQVRSGVTYLNGAPLRRTSQPPAESDLPDGLGPVLRFDEQTPDGRHYTIQLAKDAGESEDTGVYRVPPRCYFILDDNRDDSLDSRFDPTPQGARSSPACGWDKALDARVPMFGGVGFVPAANLIGKVQLVVFSWDNRAGQFRGDRSYKPIS